MTKLIYIVKMVATYQDSETGEIRRHYFTIRTTGDKLGETVERKRKEVRQTLEEYHSHCMVTVSNIYKRRIPVTPNTSKKK